ncbi:MAG: hypothetical protein IPN71_13235 [Fibrobacteres bacterium]|jgi:lipoate-protein ligase A|nr:hypothetical protein [Fibrobacterota bacterium]
MSQLRIDPLRGGSGAEHMRTDTALFHDMELALKSGDSNDASLPILRLYTWNHPTVSLGKNQSPETALAPRWEAWSQDPLSNPQGPAEVVHRPTGGRAVWHQDELTYSVVFPIDHPLFQGGARSPEEVFGLWLLESGKAAGIESLSLERGGSSRDPLGLGPAPCFASTSRHELKWHGLKWVGSARKLGQKALLQHGSIRLGPAGDRLESWLTGLPLAADTRPWHVLPSADSLAQQLMNGLILALDHA